MPSSPMPRMKLLVAVRLLPEVPVSATLFRLQPSAKITVRKLSSTVPPVPEAHTLDSTCCTHMPLISQLLPVVSSAPPPPSTVARLWASESMWKFSSWQEYHWNAAPNGARLGAATSREISLYPYPP